MSKLKKSERELLESVESGEWRSVPGREVEVSRYQEYAAATFRSQRDSETSASGGHSVPNPRGKRAAQVRLRTLR